ncbi:50S ribosomal protein L9 [Tenericutes bacterium MZ-XQ]|jgi:ribosomal protein L9|nr:50S ribosomal protein L9 [Tenericutes bacterium MZ-XQ]
MKRWILLTGVVIILGFSIYLYWPYFSFESAQHILKFIFLFISVILVFTGIYISLNQQTRQKIRTLQNRLSMWTKLSYHVNQVGDEVFNELPIGILACDETFEIKWANPHATQIFDQKIAGRQLKDLNEKLYTQATNNKIKFMVEVGSDIYDVTYRPDFNFFYLFNVTERERISKKYIDQIPALGIIYLDNLDEALAALDVSEQSSLKGEYLAAINDWAHLYDGYLKPYADERIFLMCYRKDLEKMIENKFEILEKIRDISNQNKVRVSISMGIASWNIDYESLGVYAQNAVELAEKRGGDQVVVNIQDQKIIYFGARNDTSAKSSRVGVRINAQTIKDFIDNSSKVFIMGHNQADMDAFGSMIACYHMAKASNKPTYLIIDHDKLDRTTQKVVDIVKNDVKDLMEHMISSEDSLELFDDQSVLMILDTQSPKIIMNDQVLSKTEQIIVIDHHRVGDEGFNAMFSIIEPSASSTIELVMELLGFYNMNEEIHISPLEATMMYAGLIVDTNNFTYRTGSRTFEVAAQLKDLGADTSEVKTWLRKDYLRTMEINKLLNDVEIFMDHFAFVITKDIYDDRILLAQVADAALQINDIDAAFAISRMDDDTVGVSARSFQKVNVQVLLENIGGGGHFSVAAAQVKNKSIKQVVDELKNIIELEYAQGGDLVKVILLEDVKGKGKKDQVIDVANGYGQFLVNQKKALLATDENLAVLEKQKQEALEENQRHIALMKSLKGEIDGKKVKLSIQIGQDGKMFGAITTKQIVEAFEQEHHILIDKKKVELQSEINSVGIYTAFVTLHKDIKAQFEVHIVEK